ncbi:hypothetical protein ACWCXX_24825 [Streptomyces sp. NPDC001732]
MSANEILKKMEAALHARAEAIKPLAEIQGQRADLLRQLAALDEPYGQAYADAEAAGWSVEELAEIDIEEPAKRPKGRPKSRRATKKSTAPVASGAASSAAAVPAQGSAGSEAPATAESQPI